MKKVILQIISFHEGECNSISKLRKDIKEIEEKYNCFINFQIQDGTNKSRDTREKS